MMVRQNSGVRKISDFVLTTGALQSLTVGSTRFQAIQTDSMRFR